MIFIILILNTRVFYNIYYGKDSRLANPSILFSFLYFGKFEKKKTSTLNEKWYFIVYF